MWECEEGVEIVEIVEEGEAGVMEEESGREAQSGSQEESTE